MTFIKVWLGKENLEAQRDFRYKISKWHATAVARPGKNEKKSTEEENHNGSLWSLLYQADINVCFNYVSWGFW